MNEHLFQLLLVLIAGTVGALPGVIRTWRTAERAEGAKASDFGKLVQRVDDLSGDFENFCEGTRKRFERLERKEQALEQHVTGKMPRISGEGPTNG